MAVPITVDGDRAIILTNPEAKAIQFLDRWTSHGYFATLGQLGEEYMLQKVIYDLTRVPFTKVQEVARSIDTGKFKCPVCQKMTKSITAAKVENVAERTTSTATAAVPPAATMEPEESRRIAVESLIQQLDAVVLMGALRTRPVMRMR